MKTNFQVGYGYSDQYIYSSLHSPVIRRNEHVHLRQLPLRELIMCQLLTFEMLTVLLDNRTEDDITPVWAVGCCLVQLLTEPLSN